MTEQTKWEVFGSEDTTAIWVEDESGKRVCTVRNGENDLDRARLIAAAPDLLEALEAFRSAFELDGIQTNNIPAEMALGSAIEKARAAIKKARGE